MCVIRQTIITLFFLSGLPTVASTMNQGGRTRLVSRSQPLPVQATGGSGGMTVCRSFWITRH